MHRSKQLCPLCFISLQVLVAPAPYQSFLPFCVPPWLLRSLGRPNEPVPMDNDTPVNRGCAKENNPHPSSDIYELGVNGTHPRSRATITLSPFLPSYQECSWDDRNSVHKGSPVLPSKDSLCQSASPCKSCWHQTSRILSLMTW